jgi:hypothetical protein
LAEINVPPATTPPPAQATVSFSDENEIQKELVKIKKSIKKTSSETRKKVVEVEKSLKKNIAHEGKLASDMQLDFAKVLMLLISVGAVLVVVVFFVTTRNEKSTATANTSLLSIQGEVKSIKESVEDLKEEIPLKTALLTTERLRIPFRTKGGKYWVFSAPILPNNMIKVLHIKSDGSMGFFERVRDVKNSLVETMSQYEKGDASEQQSIVVKEAIRSGFLKNS